MQHTIYVFKSSITEFDHVLAPGRLEGRARFEPLDIENVDFDAQAYLQKNKRARPPWLEEIGQYCQIVGRNNIWNQTNSLIVAIRTVSGTICALTRGQGHHNLNTSEIIEGYGLDLAHRIMRPNEVKSIDSKGVGDGSLQKRHVASGLGDLSSFPLNYYRDRIKRIEGRCDNHAFGRRFSGGTSCTILGAVTFPELGALCESIVTSRALPKNRRLAATQPYTEVNDAAILTRLRRRLRRALTGNAVAEIGVFVPDVQDWNRIADFSMRYNGGDFVDLADLDPVAIVERAGEFANDHIDPTEISIRATDGNGLAVFEEPFEQLATYETTDHGKPYALSDGKWFLLNQDYVNSILEKVAEIEVLPKNYLVDWPAGCANEEDYNNHAAPVNHQTRRCLDRASIPVAGLGTIEPCDQIDLGGDLIYVKKWTKSQSMSALLKQGEVAAHALRNHQDYRDGLLSKLTIPWRNAPPWNGFSAGFRAPRHRIVYAIPDAPHRTLPDDLPIFSKISLTETVSRLQQDNFRVALARVRKL